MKQSLFPVNGVKSFVQMFATAPLRSVGGSGEGGTSLRGDGGRRVCESVEEPV